jgi:hypothetical protein
MKIKYRLAEFIKAKVLKWFKYYNLEFFQFKLGLKLQPLTKLLISTLSLVAKIFRLKWHLIDQENLTNV